MIERLLDDSSPLVRGAAVGALAQLAPRIDIERLRARYLALERDSDVRAEWDSPPEARSA